MNFLTAEIKLSALDYDAQLSEIKALCTSAARLEELIALWVRSQRELAIGYNESMPMPCVSVAFSEDNQSLAVTSVTVTDLIKTYGPIPPLNEATFNLADKEGYVADEDWFLARNRRLQISWVSSLEHWVAPPSALGELILSYVFSTWGFVKIRNFSVSHPTHDRYLLVALVFFGKDDDKGWHEELLVSETALHDYSVIDRTPTCGHP